MKTKFLPILLSAMMAGGVYAQSMTKDQYDVAKEKISADHRVAKARCDTLKDNAKDICEKQADGTENVAKAELEQRYKPSNSNARKVAEEKAKKEHEVAKERCDDLTGNAEDKCEKDADLQYAKAKEAIAKMKN